MRKYLELFKEGFPSNISEKTSLENKPYVGYDVLTNDVVYTIIPAKEEEPEIDLTIPYVTFTAEEAGSSIGLESLSTYQTLEYSTNTSDWTKMTKATNITLNNIGDKVYVRGILKADNTDFTQFQMSGKIAASGNCNAIWNYQDLSDPLKKRCGFNMFRDCTALTSAPELPATSLRPDCYSQMFMGCTSLTTAPELPATKLASSCYYNMFYGCTSLTTAPELPAKELADYCYGNMFNGCINLTQIPEILPATVLEYYCYMHMFRDCTALTSAPELPATKLVPYCYQRMFYGCSNIKYIKCLATNITANYCTDYWSGGVSNTGTFIKHPNMSNWSTGMSGIPSGWKVEDAVL